MTYSETNTSTNANIYKASAFILIFIILISFFWVLGFSLNFSILRCKNKRYNSRVDDNSDSDSNSESNSNLKADPGRTLVFDVIISLIFLFLIWAFPMTKTIY